MSSEKQLSDVQVGEELIQTGYGYGRLSRVVRVERLTATQIITADARFNRRTGYAPSSNSYHRTRVYIAADGEVIRVREKNEVANLSSKMRHSVKWETLPLVALRDINAILKQHGV